MHPGGRKAHGVKRGGNMPAGASAAPRERNVVHDRRDVHTANGHDSVVLRNVQGSEKLLQRERGIQRRHLGVRLKRIRMHLIPGIYKAARDGRDNILVDCALEHECRATRRPHQARRITGELVEGSAADTVLAAKATEIHKLATNH